MRTTLSLPRALPLVTLMYVAGLFLGAEVHLTIMVGKLCILGGMFLLLLAKWRRCFFGCGLLFCSLLCGLWVETVEDEQRKAKQKDIQVFLQMQDQYRSDGETSISTPSSHQLPLYIGHVLEVLSSSSETTELQVHLDGIRLDAAVSDLSRWEPINPDMVAHLKIEGALLDPIWPGDVVWISVLFVGPKIASNPGMLHVPHIAFYEQTDVWGATSARTVIRLIPAPFKMNQVIEKFHYGWLRYVAQVRFQLLSFLKEAFLSQGKNDRTAYGVIASLVLGERNALQEADKFRKEQHKPTLESSFRDAGIYHILSVSGFHLAIVSYLFYHVLSKLLLGIPRLSQGVIVKKIAAVCSICIVILYTFLTGAQIATIRAAWMALFGFLAILFHRRASLAESLSFAALCILGPWGSPLALQDSSFQLSVGSIIGIAYLHPLQNLGALFRKRSIFQKLCEMHFKRKSVWSWVLGKTNQSIEVTLGAMFMTAPLCAYYFFQFQAAAPLGNLLALPLGELLLLPSSFLGLGISWMFPKLGLLVLRLSGFFAVCLVFITDKITQLSLSFNVPPPSKNLLYLWFLGCFFVVLKRRWAFLLWVSSLVCYLVIWQWPARELRVTFFDVGQGDAAVLEIPERKVIVIDGGGNFREDAFNPGEQILIPFLRSRGYQEIDLMIASHPHVDHVRGLASLLEQFPVKELWTAESVYQVPNHKLSLADRVWQEVITLANEHQVPIQTPYPKLLGPVDIEPLAPCLTGGKVSCLIQAHSEFGPNDNSIVVRIHYGKHQLLFAGDIEKKGEEWLLSQNEISIHADVLKAPHHCSKTSSSSEFLQAVSPDVAICSVGRKNHYGFPHPEVLSRLQSMGILVYRTDLDGAIQMILKEEGALRITTTLRPSSLEF